MGNVRLKMLRPLLVGIIRSKNFDKESFYIKKNESVELRRRSNFDNEDTQNFVELFYFTRRSKDDRFFKKGGSGMESSIQVERD